MHLSNSSVFIALACAVVVGGASACGGASSTGGTGAGASKGSTTGVTSGTTSSSATGTSSSSTSSGSAGCAPTKECPTPAAAASCLGLTDNTGMTRFGVRVSELDVSLPSIFSKGIVSTTVRMSVPLDEAACNLMGSGAVNLLLQFDTAAGTLTVGGARAVDDPTKGYSFDMDVLQGFSLAPAVFDVTPDASGEFSTAAGQSLTLPLFFDTSSTTAILVPLQQANVTMGKISSGQNCVGSYNAGGLSPADGCQPAGSTSQFTTGASLTGFTTLSDADAVIVAATHQSLCAMIAAEGGSTSLAMYTAQNAMGVTVCTKDAKGNILLPGDWCAASNSAATSTCADSARFSAALAASSVIIN